MRLAIVQSLASVALIAFAMPAVAQSEPDAPTPTEDGAQALPDLSVYHLDSTWTDQGGAEIQLSALRGHPVVVLFYYGSCQHVCPILVHDVESIDGALSESVRADTRYLLVTIDPARDTPEARSAMAADKALDLDRYSLVSAEEMHTRALAALLGVQYRRNQNGHYNHSNLISLLDRDGVVVDQIEGLRQANEEFVETLEGL